MADVLDFLDELAFGKPEEDMVETRPNEKMIQLNTTHLMKTRLVDSEGSLENWNGR